MNDYTGATTIADGATLALSGQGRVNQSSGVQVDGTFDVSNASSAQINNLSGHGNVALGSNYLQINNAAGTFSGVISGVGGVNIGSGQQVFTGTNSYTGGTGIMAGAVLELGNGGTEGSVAGSITNYGAVVFNRSDDVLYNGEITGNGLFAHVGSGKLTLTTTSSSRGDVLIGPDSTLQLGSGGTTGHIGGTNFTGTIINLGTLIYDRSNAVSWKGIYAGNGEIIKEGTNTLTLTGDSSNYDGLTTVKRGKLIVGDALGNGKLGGDVTVSDGATLGGYGTLGSGAGSLVSIQSGGILSPGNSIGTLTINGDLTLQAGSFLMTELAGDGSADLVNVTGRANIVGSHLVITALDPEVSYQAGQKYNILSAGSLVSGQFADVTSNSAFLTFTLDPEQSLNAFNVALTPKTTEPEPNKPEPGEKPEPSPLFTTVANTNNQFATAQALDSLSQTGSSLALYNRLLMLSADEARAAYDNLSGEAYAAAKGALINQSQFINSAITNRLQQANGSTPTAPVATMNYVSEAKQSQAFDVVTPQTDTEDLYTGWGYAYGAWSEQDSTSNTGRMKSSVGGFVTGIDRLVYENWRLGLLAGYSHTSFNVDSRASSGSSDNYTLGAYTGTEWQLSNGNALAFSSGLAYTWHQIEMNRSVAFPAFGDNLNADYDAGTFQIFGELGYKIRLPKAVIEPYANLSYVRLGTDGFDEDGQTAAALSMNSDTMSTTFSTLGVRASTGFDLGTIPTTARADIGWRHASGDVNPVSTASFVGSNAFTVAGAPIAKDAAIIEAGLDFALSKDAILGVSYSGQFGSGAQRNGFNASLKVSF
ncbi:autotransporter domain-containing protein [Brucella sp. JSBI001]|nr:autotransporter domain-containing protein [Brucella sp. JSBI001]UZD71795.1 autotransporter domain-containing protein [Brucella sp. JSBI001]